MASSTTMPIASTRPKSVRLLRLKPNPAITAKVPMMATGTATKRDDGRPPVLQEQEHDQGHENHRVAERLEDLADRFLDERRGVVDDGVFQALGEAPLEFLHLRADEIGRFQGVGAGQLVDRQGHGRPAVEGAGLIVFLGAELDAGRRLSCGRRGRKSRS